MPPRPSRLPLPDAALPVCDFLGGALGHRLRAGVSRKEPLARAAGLTPGRVPRVVDATAGLGRDAILIAALGVPVTLIERSPAMHAALAAGLAAALEASGPPAIAAARMTLLLGDARDLLPGLAPDVVLVDPMHPERTKSALVKQEMRRVRATVGADADALSLMQVALREARQRVVLKWPLRAASMPGLPPPHHAILSRTLRFEVFMPAAP